MFKRGILALVGIVLGTVLLTGPVRAETIALTPENTVTLRGEVSNDSVAKVTNEILLSKADHLYLFIDSPGGSIFAGLRLISALHASDKKVTCIANTAISMAFVILQACDQRLILDKALLMQHVAAYSLEGQEPNNTTWAAFFHKLMYDLDSRQAKRLDMTADAFRAKTRNDWWMWGQEAIENKAADKIVDVTCSPEMFTQFDITRINVLWIKVDLKFFKCPLVSTLVSYSTPDETKKPVGFDKQFEIQKEQFNANAVAEKQMLKKFSE